MIIALAEDGTREMSSDGEAALAGGARSSSEDSEGSEAEDEAHHRTVRGREAQQIVQQLRSSYLHRSMSAPDAALTTGPSTLLPDAGLLRDLACSVCSSLTCLPSASMWL